jgi:hypothetical protein
MKNSIKYPKSKEYVDSHLVPHRYCNRCDHHVLKSGIPDEYPYQCMYCDEDLYSIETHIEENDFDKISDFDYENLIEQTQILLELDKEGG